MQNDEEKYDREEGIAANRRMFRHYVNGRGPSYDCITASIARILVEEVEATFGMTVDMSRNAVLKAEEAVRLLKMLPRYSRESEDVAPSIPETRKYLWRQVLVGIIYVNENYAIELSQPIVDTGIITDDEDKALKEVFKDFFEEHGRSLALQCNMCNILQTMRHGKYHETTFRSIFKFLGAKAPLGCLEDIILPYP